MGGLQMGWFCLVVELRRGGYISMLPTRLHCIFDFLSAGTAVWIHKHQLRHSENLPHVPGNKSWLLTPSTMHHLQDYPDLIQGFSIFLPPGTRLPSWRHPVLLPVASWCPPVLLPIASWWPPALLMTSCPPPVLLSSCPPPVPDNSLTIKSNTAPEVRHWRKYLKCNNQQIPQIYHDF